MSTATILFDRLYFSDLPRLWIVAAGLVLIAIALAAFLRRGRHALPLPPGPKGLPLIGNLLDIPLDKPWKVYDSWSKQYGTFVPLNIQSQLS